MTGEWGPVFLGIIAAATLVMALIQVGAVLVLARVARQAQQAAGGAQAALASAQESLASLREEIRPIVARTSAIVDEASRSASLATAQMEKIDQVVTTVAARVDETSAVIQQAIVTPAREVLAIVAALRAGFNTLRNGGDPRRRRTSRSEEEDPLFIG